MEYDLEIHGWPNKNVEELMVEFNFVFIELDKILEMAQEKIQMLPGLRLRINFVLYIHKYWDTKYRYHCIEDMFKKCILFMSTKKRLDSNWTDSITYNGFDYSLKANDQESIFKMKNEILEKEFVYMSSIQVNNFATNLKFSFK
uniref:Uncharacterized protein n=1 Tax=Acrobeloides nanus TaxID=290746 RepID=A0A914DRB9_9BILA